MTDFQFPPGTKVEKATGYQFPGVVVAAFRTLAGEERYVIECTVPEVKGMLHIYTPKQLQVAK
jgi:hypothetical protein